MRAYALATIACSAALFSCGKKPLSPSPSADVQQLLELNIRDVNFDAAPLEEVIWSIADAANFDFVIITPKSAFEAVSLTSRSIIARELLDQATESAGAVWQIERNLLVIGRESDLERIRQQRANPIAPLPPSTAMEEIAAIRERFDKLKGEVEEARLRSLLPIAESDHETARYNMKVAELEVMARKWEGALTAPRLPEPEAFSQQLMKSVDHIESRDSKLAEVAEKLRDKESALNLVLVDSLNDSPSTCIVNLRLRERPLELTLQYLAEASRAGLRRDDRAVVIGDEQRLRLVRHAKRKSLPLRLHLKLIESFSTRNASLTEFLDDVYWEDTPRSSELHLAVRGELSPLKVDLQLREIPLADIIQYAAEQTNCGMMYELQTVWFLPPGAPASHHEADMLGRR
ncbi:MAG: hypothetical protein AAF585_27725 [Verrucomicrobiota bacterium]